MSILRVSPVKNSAGKDVEASVSIHLVLANGQRILGLKPDGFVAEHEGVVLYKEYVDFDLVPQWLIRAPNNEATFYRVDVTTRHASIDYTIELPDTLEVVHLRDLADI